jgi:N-acetylmuramoyl-L-alanine amidase
MVKQRKEMREMATKSVYLSPSLQKDNIGIGDYGSECFRMNLVADVVEETLKKHRVTVYRNKPDMTLGQVVVDSNIKKPNIHFAIHSNANDGKTRGGEVFCHRFGGEGERLARAIYKELEPITPSKDRGVKEGCNHYGPGKPLYELAKTTAPAALVEIAFHDNKEDAMWIISNLEVIGIALARGVLAYFGIQFVYEGDEIKSAINTLTKKGIITDPDYWLYTAVQGGTVRGEFVAILIKRVAEILESRD